MSCLFLRPRLWQFEIWDSTNKYATYLLLGFETLNLKFCDLKLWKLTVMQSWGLSWVIEFSGKAHRKGISLEMSRTNIWAHTETDVPFLVALHSCLALLPCAPVLLFCVTWDLRILRMFMIHSCLALLTCVHVLLSCLACLSCLSFHYTCSTPRRGLAGGAGEGAARLSNANSNTHSNTNSIMVVK